MLTNQKLFSYVGKGYNLTEIAIATGVNKSYLSQFIKIKFGSWEQLRRRVIFKNKSISRTAA